MSREIKFRQWVTGHDLEGDNRPDSQKFWHYWGILGKGRSMSPILGYDSQQFTGLKDKNGVEIYEGDVVRTQQFANNFTGRKPNGYSKPRVVEWKESASLSGFNVISRSCHLYEVIGNIYENPEILEKS